MCINEVSIQYSHVIIHLLFSGFVPEADCGQPGSVATTQLHRLWTLSCLSLQDLPDKRLYIRKYHPAYKKQSTVVYECEEG